MTKLARVKLLMVSNVSEFLLLTAKLCLAPITGFAIPAVGWAKLTSPARGEVSWGKGMKCFTR